MNIRQQQAQELSDEGLSTPKIARIMEISPARAWQLLNLEQERERLTIYRKTDKGRKAHAVIALRSFNKQKR